MPRPSQDALPPKRRLTCLSCGSHHVFPAEIETAAGRVRRLRCLDCGWHAPEAEPREKQREHEPALRGDAGHPLLEPSYS